MQQSAPYLRTFTQALSGTPTALAIPSDIDPIEIRGNGSAAWNYRGLVGDAPAPVAATTWHNLPLNTRGAALVDGSGTLTVAVFGSPRMPSVPSR